MEAIQDAAHETGSFGRREDNGSVALSAALCSPLDGFIDLYIRPRVQNPMILSKPVDGDLQIARGDVKAPGLSSISQIEVCEFDLVSSLSSSSTTQQI